MTREKVYKTWRFLLPFLFMFFLVHFLKDITQDILKIPTFLDALGDVKEDLSNLPKIVQSLFIALGVGSLIAEGFLLVAIPIIFLRRDKFSKLEAWAIGIVILMLLYFLTVTLLDPRFSLVR